jgi:hypothetical protein
VSEDRYSFRRKLGVEPTDIPKNKFGQSVISEKEQGNIEVDVIVDPEFGVQAKVKSSLDFAPKILENLLKNMPENDPQRQILLEQLEALKSNEEEFEEIPEETEKDVMEEHNEYIRKIMELEEEPVVLLGKKIIEKKSGNKSCVKCGTAIPINAKFCVECGTSQIVKFCAQCGFCFVDLEKFCPECGTHRL